MFKPLIEVKYPLSFIKSEIFKPLIEVKYVFVSIAQVPAPVFFARLAEKFDFLGLKTTEATEAEERKRLELEKHGEGGSLNANLTNEEYKRISPSEQWEQNKKAYEQTVKGIGSTIQEDKAATVKAMEKHIEKTFTEKSSDSKPVANLKLNVHTDGMYANQSQLSQTLLFN